MTTVRKILKYHGIRPRKSLGQSFLEDKNIINKIIGEADIQENNVVVEIGAGLGIMTELLAEKAGRVIAIDVDPQMTDILRKRLGNRPHVDIIEQDILSFDFLAVPTDTKSGKLRVIGNIPYNISTQILFRLIKYRRIISSAVLLLQKEVVDRIVASPGTKDYGIPSVILAMYAATSREMNVPAACFYPQPKVTSSLIKMVMRECPLVELEDEEFFIEIVKTSFAKRRKTLLNNLRTADLHHFSEEELVLLLNNLNIDGKRRGETLSVVEFGRLSNALFKAIKHKTLT